MSDTIDMNKVAQRLVAKLADAQFQLLQYEVAAEKLQEQRDDAIAERNALVDQLNALQGSSGEVHTITDIDEAP